MNNIPDARFVFAWIGTILGEFIGSMDSAMYALLIFTVVDYLTGVLRSIITGGLSSRVGFKGICRKVMIFCLVGIANVLDQYIMQTIVARLSRQKSMNFQMYSAAASSGSSAGRSSALL